MPDVKQLRVLNSDWSAIGSPAVGVLASATHAGVPGQRHVITSISASLFGSAAAGSVGLLIRDGASGVGTVVWAIGPLAVTASPAAGASQVITIPFPDGFRNTTYGTAITVEFVGGVANVQENVDCNGYMESKYP